MGVGCGMRDRDVGCGQNPHTLQVNICECGGVCWEAQCPCTGDFSLGRMYSTVRMRGVRCVCVRSCVYEGVTIRSRRHGLSDGPCHLPVIEPTVVRIALTTIDPPGRTCCVLSIHNSSCVRGKARRAPRGHMRTCAGPGRTIMCDGCGADPVADARDGQTRGTSVVIDDVTLVVRFTGSLSQVTALTRCPRARA